MVRNLRRFRRGTRALVVLSLILFAAACQDRDEASAPGRTSEQTDRESAPPRSESQTAAEARPPNLIVITMDTTRADALGVYGQKRPTSPNIDRMAHDGVVFDAVASSNSETLPSHATLFTGLYPFEHGVRSNVGYTLADRNQTLAEQLTAHGYRTAAEVSSAVLRQSTRIAQGFEHFRGAESPDARLEGRDVVADDGHMETSFVRQGSDITARGIEFIRAHRSEPFFLWLHYFEPHSPYDPPPRFAAKIPDSPYHAEVAAMDFQIGLFTEELERLGLADQTLVVLTADHGEGLGEHDEPTHSFLVYQTTVRTPLVFWGWRGLPKGMRVPSLVREVDVLPTVLDLLGLPALPNIEGVSLEPLLFGKTSDLSLTGYGEATAFLRTFGIPPIRYLREGRWKYIHKVNPELFDLVRDPDETTNLADQHPAIALRMRNELIQLVTQRSAHANAGESAPVDHETARQLEALGYMAVDTAKTAAIRDDAASLVLTGPDPVSRLADVRTIAIARGLVEAGSFEESLQQVTPLFERDPDNLYVQDLVRQAYVGSGRYAEALPLLEKAVARSPDDAGLALDYANAMSEVGNGTGAVALLEAGLERSPCDVARLSLLERLLRTQRDHAALIAMFESATTNCPDEKGLLNNYAWALATLPEDALRNGAEGERLIRRAIERSGEQGFAYLDTLAATLAEQGRFAEAIEVQQQAIDGAAAKGVGADALAEIRGHLEFYHAARPLRDPPAPDHTGDLDDGSRARPGL